MTKTQVILGYLRDTDAPALKTMFNIARAMSDNDNCVIQVVNAKTGKRDREEEEAVSNAQKNVAGIAVAVIADEIERRAHESGFNPISKLASLLSKCFNKEEKPDETAESDKENFSIDLDMLKPFQN